MDLKNAPENAYLLLHPEDLDGLVGMAEAIDALSQAFGDAEKWPIVNAPRRRVHSPEGVRQSTFPGGAPSRGVMGVAEHTELISQSGTVQISLNRQHQTCILHDSQTADLLGVLIGSISDRTTGYTARTALRTGATSGLGFRHLVRENARVCGLIGAGGQAVAQLLALKCARPGIETVRVASRTPETRERFARTYGPLFELDITPVATGREAITGADAVLAATNTHVPVVLGEWLEPGQHVTTISGSNKELVHGGWLDEPRREIDEAVALRADRIAVNSRQMLIQDQQADLYGLIERGELDADGLSEIGEIINGKRQGRESDDEITLHVNNGGTGSADIALAHLAYEKAKEAGRGRWMDLSPCEQKYVR